MLLFLTGNQLHCSVITLMIEWPSCSNDSDKLNLYNYFQTAFNPLHRHYYIYLACNITQILYH